MTKFICSICGFIHEGVTAPEKCPICMASASKFSEIQETTIAMDVKEKEIDGSETETIPESKETVNESIKTKEEEFFDKKELIQDESSLDSVTENSPSKKELPNQGSQSDPEEEEIIKHFNETKGILQVVKWYKETYNVGLKEAKEKVESVLIKHDLWKRGGSGCAVTIMVAITSTLSLFWLL